MLLEKGLKFYAVNFMRLNAKKVGDTTSAIRHQIHVGFGSLADMTTSLRDVRSYPEADINWRLPNVCFVPMAGIHKVDLTNR